MKAKLVGIALALFSCTISARAETEEATLRYFLRQSKPESRLVVAGHFMSLPEGGEAGLVNHWRAKFKVTEVIVGTAAKGKEITLDLTLDDSRRPRDLPAYWSAEENVHPFSQVDWRRGMANCLRFRDAGLLSKTSSDDTPVVQ